MPYDHTRDRWWLFHIIVPGYIKLIFCSFLFRRYQLCMERDTRYYRCYAYLRHRYFFFGQYHRIGHLYSDLHCGQCL